MTRPQKPQTRRCPGILDNRPHQNLSDAELRAKLDAGFLSEPGIETEASIRAALWEIMVR